MVSDTAKISSSNALFANKKKGKEQKRWKQKKRKRKNSNVFVMFFCFLLN